MTDTAPITSRTGTVDVSAPPTSPSLRGPQIRHAAPAIETCDGAHEGTHEPAPSTRGKFLFALMRRLRETDARSLPGAARAVMMVMADFTDANGEAWPAMATIAQTAGIDEKTARKAVQALSEHGWLKLRRPATPRNSARYEVRLDGRAFPPKERTPKSGGEIKAVPRRRVLDVFVRDRGRCRYCDARATSVDHVQPRALGGTNDLDNLVACCAECNTRKGARTPQQAGMLLRPVEVPSDVRA